MNLKELTIEGYKSIGKITISNPNPFTVFVGPNASGKSNIFEALDLFTLENVMNKYEALKKFGNYYEIHNQTSDDDKNINIQVNLGGLITHLSFMGNADNTDVVGFGHNIFDKNPPKGSFRLDGNYVHFFNFTRLFVGKPLLDRRKNQDDSRLNTDASNIEKVLKRILKNENAREEIMEILNLLIPGFTKVEIITEPLSGTENLLVSEEGLVNLPKHLISDGTYNILAIIAALYQSDTPQFLCIEEPENGVNPFVVKELVTIIRNRCKEKGHYIWLNTHSQTIVSQLKAEEIILVDKIEGLTQIKQIKDMDLHGLPMDEALFTNVLGGGIPW